MENNSQQGLAVLVLLLAFTWLSISLFYGGSVLFFVLAVATMAAAVVMFRKAKLADTQG